MDICVIGTGYVGLVMGVCLAHTGHRVTCLDIDEAKIKLLNEGGCPIYEPGLTDLIRRNRSRLKFEVMDKLPDSDVVVLAVGTPSAPDGRANLTALYDVAEFVGRQEPRPVIIKSTVPVGTAKDIGDLLGNRFEVISNPEFMREGSAIEDFLHPDRVVAGCSDDSWHAREVVTKVYHGIRAPIHFMSNESAELVKYASNCFLAVKISYINEIANLCEEVGADVVDVAKATGADTRIGHRFLGAGVGYGGSCFPKDVKALIQIGHAFDSPLTVVAAAHLANDHQKMVLPGKVRERFSDMRKVKLAVWGLAFKPGTDDTREASALAAIDSLRADGAEIVAFDPQATAPVAQVDDMYEALRGADALLLFTEWSEFRNVDWELAKSLMKQAVVFDGRNLWDPETVREAGFEHYAIGRDRGPCRVRRVTAPRAAWVDNYEGL